MHSDVLKSMLLDKLQSRVTSKDRRNAILDAGAKSELARLILQRAKAKLTDVRKDHFSRPVITLPFAVTPDVLRRNVNNLDSFREVTFKSSILVPDQIFQFRRYLTIHTMFRKIISEFDDERLNENSLLTQIVVDGINPYEYAVTQRSLLPVHTHISSECDCDQAHVYLIDIFNSTDTISSWLNKPKSDTMLTKFYVVPYERDMWHFNAGCSIGGGYNYVWYDTRRFDCQTSELSVQQLNTEFFTNNKYSHYQLRIQPHGAVDVLVITRAEFVALFFQHYLCPHNTPSVYEQNGFIVLDTQMYDMSMSIDHLKLSVCNPRQVGLGNTYIRPTTSVNALSTYFRLIKHTESFQGYYIPNEVINAIKHILLHVPVDEHYVPVSIAHITTFTRKFVHNNGRYQFNPMVSPVIIMLLFEALLPEILVIKRRLAMYSWNMLYDKLLRCLAQSGSSKHVRMPGISKSLETVSSMIQSTYDMTQLSMAARRYNLVLHSLASSMNARNTLPTNSRLDHMDVLIERVEALFDTASIYQTKLIRAPIDEHTMITLSNLVSKSIIRNNSYVVDISTVQSIYDDLFPGNSVIDYTAMQMQAELNDKRLVISVPYFRVSYATIFSESNERMLIRSRLRTSTAADLTGSFYNMMNALMKRNFNRQAAEMAGDRLTHVKRAIMSVFHNYAVPSWRELLGYYANTPLSPGMETINIWADKHTESDVKAATVLMSNKFSDPSYYNAMPKNQAKPILDLTAQGALAVGQTVVFHSKDIISLSVGIFTLLLERLMMLFPTSIRLAFAADEHTVGQWADTYLDKPNTYIYEFDVPKFDKSQDQMCFTLVLEVMRILGVSSDFVDYWQRASYEGTVFNTCFSMVFTLFYGNRSGSGGTLAVNCICLLFAFFTEFASLNIVAALIKGDDSVLVTTVPITNDHVLRLLGRWGFSLKQRTINKYVSFCSGVFVKNSSDKYQLLRDPIRLLTKLGRSLSPERESAYFIDYYVSFVDATSQYNDDIALQNLKIAMISLYNKHVDVDTIVQYLRQIVVSYKVFLKELYGFNEKSLSMVTRLDDIREVIINAKQHGFIKSNMLKDICPNLKVPLIEKIRSYQREIILEISHDHNKYIDDNDYADEIGWVVSI